MVAFALRSEPKRAPKRGGNKGATGCWLGLWAVGSGCGLWARPCLPLYCCIIYILEARGFAKSWRPFFENEPKMTQTSTEAVFLSSKSTKIAFLI